jgi:methylenetetrahydrofolate dehydrogenase (NADP+) / methenyltetrahydrofolate cyclohydrolase
MKIDGKQIASDILENLKLRVIKLKNKGITPTMAIILMGDNEASAIYVNQKSKKAEEIGAQVKVFPVTETTTNEELEELIRKLDKNSEIHGIILQRPAPEHIKAEELTELVSPIKEVDGFGSHSIYPVPVAKAAYLMIKKAFEMSENNSTFEDWIKTQNISVIGKGLTAGKPIIDLLSKEGLNPIVIDSKTENRDSILKESDIIISAVGKHVLNPDQIKQGVILIGVGLFNDENGKLRGDYLDSDVENIASYFTPTPGGMGPVNVACLLENLVTAAEKKTPTHS